MKDYYRVLGIGPRTEPSEIHAAYRRLMKDYHPDRLDPAQREDPQIQQLVKEVNEAYEVLMDSARRRAYDEEVEWRAMQARSGLPNNVQQERIRYLVRCGKTRRTFTMHLVRPKGSTGPFVVLGFEPLPELPLLAHAVTSPKNIWGRIASVFGRQRQQEGGGPSSAQLESHDLSEEEIQALLDESVGLSMGDIDWNYFACPDCGSVTENKNGTFATWSGCSKCGHIKCVGSVERTRRGVFSTCPWCGKRNKMTRSVPLGKADHLTLKGRTDIRFRTHAAGDSLPLDPAFSRELDDPQ